jgi:putative ABC transport system permease protein
MNDFRLAVRTLSKSPGLTAIAVITLALGIGANTAIFSVIHAVLLRATPYPNADRLVRIHEHGALGPGMSVSPLNFQDWKRDITSFERLSLFRSDEYTIGDIDPPIRALGAEVSAELFPMLGASAQLGRVFTPAEDKPGAPPTVVIGYGLWQQRFGGDPSIVGRRLNLDAKPYIVVGVLPAAFDFPEHMQFWIPAGLSYDAWNKRPRSVHFMEAVGELKPGVTLARAQSELEAIANELARKYPTTNEGFGVALTDLHDDTVASVRPALLALLAGVGFVLLIACTNVANLHLARTLQRKKDLAIRVALGASRVRVMRQLVGESLILALAGGAVGIACAAWSVESLTRLVSATLPHARFIRINLPVLGFTLAAALLTGLLVGLASIWQSFKTDLTEALKDTGRSTTGGLERQRMRGALVVAEIALSFVLLIGAGLMVRTFMRLAAVDLGFRPDHLLTMKMSLPNEKYPADRVLRKIREVPGVQNAALANPMPLTNDGWQDIFVQPGEPKRTMSNISWTHMMSVSPGYFEAMRIPLLSGRLFDERDGELGREAAIVDEIFVQRYWPHDNPLGKRIKNDFDSASKEPWITVVGVVGHVKNSGPEQTWAKDPLAETYIPHKQEPFHSWTVTARTMGAPATMTAALEDAIHSVDRGIPISDVRTMDEWVAQSLAYRRFSMLLLAIFAAVGLVLALVGVYGVMSYSVTQRLHEIGIRMALGAEHGDVVKLVLGNAMKLAGIGLGVGFVLSLLVSRRLAQVVFGVSSTDPSTYISVSTLLALAALAAGYIPARRATLIDPSTALREE